MVKLLISKKGIDLNAYSILNDEIYKNIWNIMFWMILCLKQFYFTALHEAVFIGNINIIKLLLEQQNIDPNKTNRIWICFFNRILLYAF